MGWYLQEIQNGQEIETRITYLEKITSNIQLVGKFTKEVYYITIISESEGTMTIQYTVEDSIIELPLDSKDGYTFLGWRDIRTDAIYNSINPRLCKDLTLTGVWEAIPVEENNSTMVIVITAVSVVGGAAIVIGGIKLISNVRSKRRRQQKAQSLIESLNKMRGRDEDKK